MKKVLELASLVALGTMAWMTWTALYGPDPLPQRVPTHFDSAGNANGWGSPGGIVLLPLFGVLIYGVLSVAPIFRSAFNYPVKVTAENRERLQTLALQLISFLKFETLALFLWIEHSILQAMRQGHGNFIAGLMPIFLGVVLGTLGVYIVAMIVAGKPSAKHSGPLHDD